MVITFLSSASEKFIMEFFKRNIVYIMKIIQQDLPYNASERITALHQKVGCLQMVKAFYELLPNDATKTGSELDTMWVDSNDNTAQQHKQREIKNTLYTTFTSMREEPLASDLRKEAEDDRKAILCYNQAVLNAFIAFSLRFAVKEALFVKIFGKAGKFSRQYIWNSVVDVTHTICLKLELDQPLVKSRLQDLHAASGKLPSDDERNITYMASIALTGSR
ncbi:hypothetical protein BDF20DRAFT_642803 [Mycotypha africana]|uniref:uncharacterized protein n=1 Tax=Mycotypha africana TaxID=64632 RepID=UPI00230088A4|nr:uncharacterized protein BDF20DRAFT_642803 [Mycotypha africana]KAI8973302.1 hypothetical protein BDF20DRAFT_642803 [Mycotypha africana]